MTPNALEILAFVLFGAALVLGMVRLVLGPGAGDRIVAADTLGVVTTSGIAALAWWLDSELYLDVALVYGVLAFTGVVAIARAMETNEP